MTMHRKSTWLGLSVIALTAALILPALAQESLLPEGFGVPTPPPAPVPTPGSTPTPSVTPVAPSLTPKETDTVSTTGSEVLTSEDDGNGEGAEDSEEPRSVKYDLPPGARRLLTRIGPLTPETGGFAPDALGARGQYAAAIMQKTRAPIVSRWAEILLRRAMLSALDTPETINGADLTAARAALLLRMGESQAARRLVEAVDTDRATPRLVTVAQQVYLANADPAGMCAYVPAGLDHGNQDSWRLSAGICSALTGEPGPAGWAIDRVRNGGRVANFDILLAERVLGASLNGRRAVTIQWDGIDRLTSWRFGLATATSTPIPTQLRANAANYFNGWTVQAPMTEMADRVAAAPQAALRGILSGEAYVSLIGAAESDDGASEAVSSEAQLLREAFSSSSAAERLTAMQEYWGRGGTGDTRYAAMVATSRAAAGLPVTTDVGDDGHWVLGSMLAGGYDRNALAWVPEISVGSRAWGVLAVGLSRPLDGMSASAVNKFSADDDSVDSIRSQFLLAGLAGLGRIEASDADQAARDLKANLTKQTRWTRAIDAAAQKGQPAMVALLVATGMQGRDWSKLPPYHLYHIVRALREVGLEAEARMIAAESLVRV
jgi:hypothetical protein